MMQTLIQLPVIVLACMMNYSHGVEVKVGAFERMTDARTLEEDCNCRLAMNSALHSTYEVILWYSWTNNLQNWAHTKYSSRVYMCT